MVDCLFHAYEGDKPSHWFIHRDQFPFADNLAASCDWHRHRISVYSAWNEISEDEYFIAKILLK